MAVVAEEEVEMANESARQRKGSEEEGAKRIEQRVNSLLEETRRQINEEENAKKVVQDKLRQKGYQTTSQADLLPAASGEFSGQK
jgi:uncharacterized damage-inducible protein DinB